MALHLPRIRWGGKVAWTLKEGRKLDVRVVIKHITAQSAASMIPPHYGHKY